MDRELLIAAGPGEWRAALLEDGVAVELYVERGERSEAGSIYLGRVLRLVRGLGAALVDIGGDRPAFLPLRDAAPRGKPLYEGERVVVQIRREAQGGKAARLTMAVVLSRTAGEGAERSKADEGDAEAAAPARQWQEILKRAERQEPPARLDPPASFAATLGRVLPGMPSLIRVDDPAAVPKLRAAFPSAAVEHRSSQEWQIDLDEVFRQALAETLALPGGGAVHFAPTRAGTLIDIDTGTPETGSPERTALTVNLAAARVIARQIRLRQLGGGIIADFVGLDSRVSRDRVRAALAEALAPDPAVPRILGWTRLGHLELVRPRHSRPLAEALLEGRIKTSVTVAFEALRMVRREARAQPGRQWRLTVAPDVAAVLTGVAAAALRETQQRFARNLTIEPDSGYGREQFQIAAL